MFHLASSLYTQYTKREQYNILILGLDNAGKSTFLEHLKLLYPPAGETNKKKNQERPPTTETIRSKRILPTVGQNVAVIGYRDRENPQFNHVNLKFWDLGGQRLLRGMWSRYYKSCHGIIFMIDSTDTERFQECYDTLIKITHDQSWNDDGSYSELVSIPILMMANKQDLPTAVDLISLKTGYFIDLVSRLEAADLKLLPVSVLENQGLSESLSWLVTHLIYNKPNRMPEYR